MKFTNRDKIQLITEVIATAIFLALLNLGTVLLMGIAVKRNPLLNLGICTLRSAFFSTKPLRPGAIPKFPRGLYLHWWIIIPLVIIDVVVLLWRIRRRYHLIQINHITKELEYIANHHFNHSIPLKIRGKNQQIVNNINKLVSNITRSMRARKKLEKSKDTLITNVSHDIRTPLTSIIGYLGLVESHRYSLPKIYQYTHVAYFKAKQMKDLANELFEYTKISRNQVPMRFDRIHVNLMLEQLAISNQLRAKKYRMRIQVVNCDPHLTMIADATKIGRALNDLIANAIKYGHAGKHVDLSAVTVDSRTVRIAVANDGQEIPPAALNLIFSRFYRIDKSRNTQTGGSGLGLAIVANVVRLHHGQIRVKSGPKMTRFVIDLPINSQNWSTRS